MCVYVATCLLNEQDVGDQNATNTRSLDTNEFVKPMVFFVGLKQKLPPPSLNFSDVVPNLFVVPFSFLQT